VLCKFLTAAALLCAAAVPALATSPSTDGTATGEFSGTTSGTASLTTTQTNDEVIVVVFAENTSGSSPTVNVPTSSHLTFAQRGTTLQSTPAAGCLVSLAVFYAFSAGTLSSETITASTGASVDGASINVFGVHGVYSSAAAWDPDASLPKQTTISSIGNHDTNAISTTNPDDLLIIALGYCQNSVWPAMCLPNFSVCSSMTSNIVNHREGSGVNWVWGGATGYTYSAAQSGVTPGMLASSGLAGFVTIADALTADAPPASGGSGGLMLLGVGN